MQELYSKIDEWVRTDKSIAIATVVKTWGSAPRGVGAKMAVNIDGDMAGSVSGGCVEGAVVEAAVDVLKTGNPKLLHFGVSDETAWDVGLACGGEIEVFVRRLNRDVWESLRLQLENGISAASLIVVRGPKNLLGFEAVANEAKIETSPNAHSHTGVLELFRRKFPNKASSGLHSLISEDFGKIDVFVDVVQPSSTLVIVGGVHIAIPLVSYAKTLGFYVVVIDPRKKFGSKDRFLLADQLINSWPKEAFKEINLTSSTAVAVLTHDPKIDDPALEVVIQSPAFYIGALGSKKTHSERRERLIQMGFSAEQVNRIHAPIGLDLNARSPEEIALAIISEIVKEKKTKNISEELKPQAGAF
jgi:xanthine dehydrogenase accessory factor